MSALDIWNKLIAQECNDPKIYQKLLPLPVVILGAAAIKAKFPDIDVTKLDIAKLVKEEIIDREVKLPQWYVDKWLVANSHTVE